MAESKIGVKYHASGKISIPLRTNFTLPNDGHVFCCTKGSVGDTCEINLNGYRICSAGCETQYKPKDCAVFARKGQVVYIGGTSPYDAWFYPCTEVTT